MAETPIVLTGLALVALVTGGMAWAGTAQDCTQGAPTPGPAMAGKGPRVGHHELVRFASAIGAIQPVDEQAHIVLTNTHLAASQKRADLTYSDRKVTTTLQPYRLSPVIYETLLHKAHVDPDFAKRTERILKKG
ncbi:DUF4168 domain-containing protein [Acidithiobacillus caldus]